MSDSERQLALPFIGATPARADNPVYADRHLDALKELGTRTVLGVGPPDPFVHHINPKWTGTQYGNGKWFAREFNYEEAVANSVDVIKRRDGDGRLMLAFASAYLFGRQVQHLRSPHVYDVERDVPEMIRIVEEAIQIAINHNIQIHTHLFRGDLTFVAKHFGRNKVVELLEPDILLEHGNGLTASEIELMAERDSHVAADTFVGESI